MHELFNQRTASSPSGISRSRLPLPTIRSTPWLVRYLGVAQGHEFGDPEPGGVENFEHRAVAVPQRIGHYRRFSSDSTSSSVSDFGGERPILDIAIAPSGHPGSFPRVPGNGRSGGKKKAGARLNGAGAGFHSPSDEPSRSARVAFVIGTLVWSQRYNAIRSAR